MHDGCRQRLCVRCANVVKILPARTKAFIRALTKKILAVMFLAAMALYAVMLRKRIAIIAAPVGNLGNRLFLFSNFIGFAIENRWELMNPAFHEYRDSFETTRHDFFCRYPPRSSLLYRFGSVAGRFYLSMVVTAMAIAKRLPDNSLFCAFDLETIEHRINLDNEHFLNKVNGKKVVFFQGWLFLDLKNMAKHGDAIRRYFAPAEIHRDLIELPISNLSKSCDVIVGLVIRRGAYKWWCNGRYYFSLDTYIRWMHEMSGLYPGRKVGFFICSDEELEVEKLAGFTFVFRPGHDIENRYSLARCDYLASAPSTYGGWAAFYGDVPMNILKNPEQSMSLGDFRRIRNHTDLRDETFAPDADVTERVSAT